MQIRLGVILGLRGAIRQSSWTYRTLSNGKISSVGGGDLYLHSANRSKNLQSTFPILSTRCFSSASPSTFEIQDYDDFKARVLSSDKVVLVDFYADWCGPCKLLGPRLEAMVDSRNGKFLLAKCNVDDLGDVAGEFEVSSIPHVVAFKNGQVVDQFVGLLEDESIGVFLDKLGG